MVGQYRELRKTAVIPVGLCATRKSRHRELFACEPRKSEESGRPSTPGAFQAESGPAPGRHARSRVIRGTPQARGLIRSLLQSWQGVARVVGSSHACPSVPSSASLPGPAGAGRVRVDAAGRGSLGAGAALPGDGGRGSDHDGPSSRRRHAMHASRRLLRPRAGRAASRIAAGAGGHGVRHAGLADHVAKGAATRTRAALAPAFHLTPFPIVAAVCAAVSPCVHSTGAGPH